MVDVCIRTSALQAVGGMKALKAVVVPTPPAGLSGLAATEHMRACIIFVEQAVKARRQLEEALDMAMRAVLPEVDPNVSLPRGKMEQRFKKLAAIPELLEDFNDDHENIATPFG
uniref:Uncharacterized protein n=1 Tax=Pyrodinium bahamense TaxID=73915 RepID=A0A7S0FF48_9DINO